MRFSATIVALIAAGGAASAQDIIVNWDDEDTKRYRDCLTAVQNEPDAAYEMALTWQYESGGMPAMHCSAAALVALGHSKEGAGRLEEAAITPDPIADDVRAELLAQAAAAWMAAEQPEDAIRVLDSALIFRPDSPDLLIDRALALAVLGDFERAAEDLSLSLSERPDDLLALRLRAQAWIELGRFEEARSDVERALKIDPEDIETLLIRGRVRQELGL